MKSLIVSMIAVAGILLAGSAMADEALLKKGNCMGCHKMQGKMMGPGFSEIATKYKGDAGAAAKLEEKIIKGGSGVWGSMAMPPMAKVTPADSKAMVAYILSLAR